MKSKVRTSKQGATGYVQQDLSKGCTGTPGPVFLSPDIQQEYVAPTKMEKIRKRIVRYKIYTDRARWYVGYVQLLLMVAIFLKTSGINIPIWGYPVMLVCIVFGFILFGFIETRLGLLKEEQDKYSRENPMMQEILKLLKEKQ